MVQNHVEYLSLGGADLFLRVKQRCARYGIRYAYGVRTHSSFARNSNQLHKCIVNDCKYNMFLETFSFKLILNWHPRGRGPTTSIVFTWVGPGTSSLTIDLSLNFWSLRPPFLNGRCM